MPEVWGDNQRVIFHADMDAFFAAVEQRDHPAWKGKPVIVGADPKGGRGRGVVSTCSYEARAFGVRSAMPISQAYRLCPAAVYRPPDMKKYLAVSRDIFAIFDAFTPDMEPVSCDEAFLDMTGSCHLFGTPSAAALAVKNRIFKETLLTASIGVAPNKFVAKIASDRCKPDGLLEVLPEAVRNFLWPLPVGCLWGVGEETEKHLNAAGIMTIGDLAGTPPDILRRKFGENGEHLWLLANGKDDRPVSPVEEIKSVSREHTFDEDTADQDILDRTLAELSEDVSRKLRKEALQGKTVTLKLRFSDFRTITRAETLAGRTNFFDGIYRCARQLFDGCWPPDRKIRLIGVRVSNFENPYCRESLFTDRSAERTENVHRAVDRIKDKFGEDAIRRGR